MRKETVQLVDETIQMLDNSCLYFGCEEIREKPFEELVKGIYKDVLVNSQQLSEYTTAIRFDGKDNIKALISKELLNPKFEHLNLKEKGVL